MWSRENSTDIFRCVVCVLIAATIQEFPGTAKPVARHLQFVATGHDVRRLDVSVYETFAVKVPKDVQDGLKHRKGFGRRERPDGKNLPKVLLSAFHYDKDQRRAAKLSAPFHKGIK